MSAYSSVRGGQLKLKGASGGQFKKKKKKKRKHSLDDRAFAEGELKHGQVESEFSLWAHS